MKVSNRFYDVAKWLCMIVFPAVATLISILDKAWNWGFPVESIVSTISAVDAFLGAVLGFSTAQYNAEKDSTT